MNPWMLREVRKDDVATMYEEAERSRLAATVANESLTDQVSQERSNPISGVRYAIHSTRVRWAAGIALVAALLGAAVALVG